MTTLDTTTIRNIKPRKYFLGISLLGLLPSLSAEAPTSSSPLLLASVLKLRTLSAVSEAARGQVRMELKAAPGVKAANTGHLHRILRLFTNEPEGEDDHSERSQKFKYKVSKLTDRESLKKNRRKYKNLKSLTYLNSAFLMETRSHDQDED